MKRRGSIIAIVVATSATPAFAQDRKAEAESLFEAGRVLVAQKRYAEACPKFAESYRLEPGIGTLANLASCQEQLGKTATAWASFREVISAAQRAGDGKRLDFAKKRADALEKKLSRLSVVVPEESRIKGLEITRDGQPLGEASWGSPLALDPGEHVVEAHADGREPFSSTVTLGPDADQKVVQIPILAVLATSSQGGTAKPEPAPQPPREGGMEPRVVVGWTGIVVGGAAIVASGVVGLVAKSKNDDAKAHCPTDSTCDRDGLGFTSDASSLSSTATGLAIIGGIVLVAGVSSLLFWPKRAPANVLRGTF